MIETDYGMYDDDDMASMLEYCCHIRGNPEESIHKTITEFGWFVDLALWGGYIGSVAKSKEERDEAFKIYHTYKGWVKKDEPAAIFWSRMFVDYCTKEYCND